MLFRNLLQRFNRDERGNAAVEYAIVLGLILAVTFLGLDVLSRTTESAFQKVGDALGTGEVRSASVPVEQASLSPKLDENAKLQLEVAQSNLWVTLAISGVIGFCLLTAVVVVWVQTKRKLRDLANQSNSLATVQRDVKYVQPKLIAKRQHILKMLATNIDRLLHSTLQVRQLMTTNVATIHPEMLIEDLKDHMKKLEIRHIMVISHDGKLLGVISDRDVKSKPGKNAGQIMTREMVTVHPNVEISPAVTMMLDHAISCLPVVENGELKGIVTSTDLMMAIQCCMHVLRNATEAMDQAAASTASVQPVASQASSEDSSSPLPSQA